MGNTNQATVPRPMMVKAINGIGRVLEKMGFPFSKLDEQTYLNKAQQKTGCSDFGDANFREGLQQLLYSLKHEAKLNPMGLLVANNQIEESLVNRLKIVDFVKAHPSIATRPIKKPIIVAGLPRTGTTILHSLLAQDPRAHGPLSWETLNPLPPKTGPDNRIQKTQRQLDMLCKMIPGFEAVHPMGAELPTECLTIHALNFTSLQFMVNFNIPGYCDWYLNQDFKPTLEFHKLFLQVLDYFNPTDHWVLKTPAYFSTLDAIFEVYPDACIIQTHREPARVLPSTASLFYYGQQLCSDSIDPKSVAQSQIAFWSKSINKGLNQRLAMPARAHQFFDITFQQLMESPLKAIESIYRHFDMELSDQAVQAMQRFLANHGREKHGKHHYSAQMYGITPNQIEGAFSTYNKQFKLAFD